MPDANKAAVVLKDALPSPEAWALTCCVVHLLKLSINAQCSPGKGANAEAIEDAQHKRRALRGRLAECFANVWFPAARAADAGEDGYGDYAQLLAKAAGTAANHVRFLEMFLV